MHDIVPRLAPATDWQDAEEREHFVQFYEDDGFLLESVGEYLGDGLESGSACVAIATQRRLDALEAYLQERGLDVAAARDRGQYVPLNAAEVLAHSSVDEHGPERDRFIDVVGTIISDARQRYPRVRAFGEMVALLCLEGQHEAAIRLEQLWNELATRHHFSLFCAYPMRCFGSAEHARPFHEICAQHARVIPAEDYAARTSPGDRLLMICELQQKANALQCELAERRRLEEELRDKITQLADRDRRKDEFLAMLAHELRNPLAPLRNVTEVLKRLGPADSTQRQIHEVLDRQVQQMTRLLDDLLDVARVTRGMIQLQVETHELLKVISGAIESSRSRIDARSHRLSIALPREPVRIRGDLARLVQMFSNLLNNAARYTPEHGEIALSAEQRDGAIDVRIEDNGVGIAPELLPRIFDLFAQADRTPDRSEGGLGIGLTLVRSIAQLHGGSVQAQSRGAGKGSVFTVTLPALADARAGPGVEMALADTAVLRPRRRILVVDDNRDSAESMAALLRMDGHEVLTAFDGASALDWARSRDPDLILLDIGMAHMNGYEVAQRLRSADSRACVVAMSGYGQPEDRRRSIEAGFDAHLVKPTGPDELQRVLAQLRGRGTLIN